MNIFVGLNDAGKSNVIKALNLFFNNNTDYDTEFDFSKDFSYLFPKKSHSTKEITVQLKIEIPSSFQNSGVYLWKKAWRKNEPVRESILDESGNAPGSRSRIPYTLHRIKFRYVPAIKSRDFYKYLLSELYLTAAASLNSPLADSTKEFAGVIQNYTEQIHKEVIERIGIDSKLTIPPDMSEMFKTLIFMTKGTDKYAPIPLDMRGDGIQSRHIPIILKYLAEEDQKARTQGSVKITSIWGYEEPENGIELLKSFELADSFLEYSKEIQMFITTHSPAFYHQVASTGVKVFYVNKNETDETNINENINTWEIGKTMGLMPLVAPLIAEKEKELRTMLYAKDDELFTDIPTIFVEGITDKKLITVAIDTLSSNLSKLIHDHRLRIFTKEGEGGCLKINDWIHAWIYKGNKSKVIALFDKDLAGKHARDELVNSPIFSGSRNCKALFLPPTEAIKSVYRDDIDLYYEIEHILSTECWKKIIDAGYAQERSSTELNSMIEKYADKNRTTMSLYNDRIKDTDILNTIVLYEPKENSKDKIVRFIETSSAEERKEFLAGFQDLITTFEERFIEG